MMTIRRSFERGIANHGWLNSHHTFSFGGYYDAQFMGFGPLRVINEDRVQPGEGFPTHGHSDMEIISYVVEGGLEHKDTLGTGSIIRPGDVQRMSAGSGIRHSEYNASTDDPVHFLQIWIMPEKNGIAPSYEQKAYPDAEKTGQWRLVGSNDGRDGSVIIHQDVALYSTLLPAGKTVDHATTKDRLIWIQAVKGEFELGGETLAAGDGAAISDKELISITAAKDSEILLFDMTR